MLILCARKQLQLVQVGFWKQEGDQTAWHRATSYCPARDACQDCLQSTCQSPRTVTRSAHKTGGRRFAHLILNWLKHVHTGCKVPADQNRTYGDPSIWAVASFPNEIGLMSCKFQRRILNVPNSICVCKFLIRVHVQTVVLLCLRGLGCLAEQTLQHQSGLVLAYVLALLCY